MKIFFKPFFVFYIFGQLHYYFEILAPLRVLNFTEINYVYLYFLEMC